MQIEHARLRERALRSADVLEEQGGELFALTPLGTLLKPGVDGSVHAWARLGASLYDPWRNLLEAIRTGRTAFDRAHGKSRWQHFSDTIADSQAFNEAMAESAVQVARILMTSCELARFESVVDVGGGNGILVREVLQARPDGRGVVFDLPEGLRDAKPHPRCTLVSGSFFESVPQGGDAYILSRVLHDWDDGRATEILRNTRRAMRKHERGARTDARRFSALVRRVRLRVGPRHVGPGAVSDHRDRSGLGLPASSRSIPARPRVTRARRS